MLPVELPGRALWTRQEGAAEFNVPYRRPSGARFSRSDEAAGLSARQIGQPGLIGSPPLPETAASFDATERANRATLRPELARHRPCGEMLGFRKEPLASRAPIELGAHSLGSLGWGEWNGRGKAEQQVGLEMTRRRIRVDLERPLTAPHEYFLSGARHEGTMSRCNQTFARY